MKKPEIEIAGRKIGENHNPYIIAEISANHNGKIENIFELILKSKKANVDAVKIQTYTPDTITLNSKNDEFKIATGLWKGRTLYDLYSEAYTPFEWHKEIFEFSRKANVTLFSSPFDNSAIDLLEDLNTPAYKIASFEIVDLPLIKYAASTKKPIILSTGMATFNEISEAVEVAKENGCKDIAVLRTVSGYPAPSEDYNLKTIVDMRNKLNLVTGLSDHTLNNITAITSIALGASIIEKHITLNRNGNGPDDKFSLEPDEFKQLCENTKISWSSLGEINYGPKISETQSLKHRRSLYFIKDLKKGEIIDESSIKSIRPSNGLHPKYYDYLIGKKLTQDVKYGTPTSLKFINEI